jgi:hypothetical protein
MLRAHSQTEKAQMGPKIMLGRLVGNMGEKNGYRIWIPNERKILLSRDIPKPKVVCNSCNDSTQTKSVFHTPCSSSFPYIQPLVRTSGLCGFILYFTLGHVGGGNK